MTEPITLTDDTIDGILNGKKPALLIFSSGSVRGDFLTEFNKAAAENDAIVFARINPDNAPNAAARFEVGQKAVMIAWANGEVVARRGRPWGSDVPSAVATLQAHVPAAPAEAVQPPTQAKETPTVYNKPVNVTDETFQNEVIDSDLPVLVDFWAEWCGPCRMVAPVLDKLAAEFEGKVKIAKVNVDENPGLSQTFQIRSIPNMMALKEKTIVFNQPGALPEPALRDLVQQLIDLEIPEREDADAGEPEPEAGD
jgi:thioredoxin 1